MASSISPFIPTFALLLSLLLLFLLAPRILPPCHRVPPISFPDELDDLTLFRRASAESARPLTRPSKSRLGSTNPKPKIAFLFLTNSDLHFYPLWERFFDAKSADQNLYNLYVHADPTVKVKRPGGVFSEDRFIPAKKTQRGTATLISAARRLLANALLDDPANAFFTLISQHCIPLHSFNFLYNALFEVKSHQLAELKMLKYRSFIEIISKGGHLWDRYNARGKDVMLPEVPFERFRVGSQFFTITRRHAVLVVKDQRLWKKFKLPCLRAESCYPEEHYFPTLLSMEDLKGCTEFTLTGVNWTGTVNGHPHMYYPREVLPELIYKLRESNFSVPYLFARKFSPNCLSPLLDMAEQVIFKD